MQALQQNAAKPTRTSLWSSCMCRLCQGTSSLIEDSDCPQCTTEHAIELSSISSPSKLLLQLLGRVQVRCTQCKRLVFAEAAEQHVHSNCSQHTITSLDAMTEQPVTTPLNEEESR